MLKKISSSKCNCVLNRWAMKLKDSCYGEIHTFNSDISIHRYYGNITCRKVRYLLIVWIKVNHFDSLLLLSDSILIEEHISTASSSNSLYLSPIPKGVCRPYRANTSSQHVQHCILKQDFKA